MRQTSGAAGHGAAGRWLSSYTITSAKRSRRWPSAWNDCWLTVEDRRRRRPCAAACGVDDRDADVVSEPPGGGSATMPMDGPNRMSMGGSGATAMGGMGATPTGGSDSAARGGASATAEEGATSTLGRSDDGGDGGDGGESTARTAEPIGGCFQQLLANADFDGGHAGWTETGSIRDVIVAADDPALVAASVTPRSGQYLAWLGGIPNGPYERYQTTLVQEVAFPSETLSLTLSGYAWVEQNELGLEPNDWAVLEIQDPEIEEGYDGLWRVQLWSELTVTNGWVRFEEQLTDVERIRGRTLRLVADSRPSGNGTLSVWLDSLRLEARCTR